MAEIIMHPSAYLISGLARENAINHIIKMLDYDNFLCKCIKLHTDFSSGNVFSVFPSDICIDNIVDFSWGYGKGSDKYLHTRILKTLKSFPGSVAVFDDVMAESAKEEFQGSCLGNDNQAYHWLFEHEANELNVSNLVVETGVSWHFLCVIFQPDRNIDIKNCIMHSRCDSFKNVIEVVIGAFDGEGYLHWSPNDAPPAMHDL